MKKVLSWIILLALVCTSLMAVVACKPDEPEKTVSKISIEDVALSCYVGDAFDGSKIRITITYSDDTSETKTVGEAKASVTQVDTSTAGAKEITVTLGGKTATTTVMVRVKPEGGGDSDDFNYYATSKLPADKKIYVLNETSRGYNFNADELFTAQAIQGLFARKETSVYVDSHYMTNGVNIDMYYLNQIAEEHGLTLEYVTMEQAVAKYVAEWDANVADGTWGSQIPLTNYVQKKYNAFVEGEDYSTPGYIVYKQGTISVNLAATLAGLTGFLPVEADSEDVYKAMGLVKKMDVNNVAFTYKWLFEVDGVMNELSDAGLIHQNYKDESGKTNKFIKDYGISNKYFHVYYDEASAVTNTFKKSLHSFLKPNSPIFGYTYSEDSDVAFFSQYGQFIVPTDYSCNLTFFSAEELGGRTFTQPNSDVDKPAEQGKHYVAFVVSDGDNATYWQNTAAFATNYMNASGRDNDSFPVTWSITPSLADLMPSVLENVYSVQSNDYDYFCAPVSGHGYINAGNFAAQNNGAYFQDFCEKLNIYMGKAGLSAVTVIGGNQQGNLPEVLAGYASCDNVKGGIVYEGSKYFGNVRGGVMWVNGKPFVGPRDSLWETTPAYIAARINTYEKDVTKIDGYTIVNVHPWSHSYEDIRTIVNMLNDDVEVVSIDRIIKMMTDNIVDKSNTNSFNIPEKNGISISVKDLEDNPSLIPVDPLYNDFLLWEEDWSGSGVAYRNSDPSASNVGAIYKGNISIAAGTTATKREFTLPDTADYWFSFNARGDATDKTKTATFTVSMTVDGVKKDVIKNVTVKGVEGTETMSVSGDGWQCFAFPLKQYFPEYRGKTCTVEISVASGDTGIRIDQVRFTDRKLDAAIDQNEVNPLNNKFTSTTEDWMLGEQYKTSQYYWWSTLDRESLNPINALQIDCSDGGGDEKRNHNTNVWMAKNYVLPQNVESIKFGLSSDGDYGAEIKIAMYVDGEYIVLFDWSAAHSSMANTENTVNLADYADIDFAGKEVTIVFEARDGGNHNGVGEACRLHYFQTTVRE